MPTGVSAWFAALVGALAAGLGRIVGAIPSLLGAIVVLLIGWGIGKLIQSLVTRGLNAVHFDNVTERAGVNNALSRAEIKTSPSAILGIVAYWFVFLLAVDAAVNILGISALTALMTSVIAYLPRIFAALLVVVAGAWAAGLLGRLTRASATTANIAYASVLGGVVQGAVLFFTFAMALDVLGLAFPFLTTAFALIVGAVALGAALAFGLGGREYASDILAGRELRSVFTNGDLFVSDQLNGTIKDIRPTLTIVQTNKGEVTVQNSELMHQHVAKPTNPGEGGSMPKAA